MRVNKFVAQATGLSRRAVDRAIQAGRVTINQQPVGLGTNVTGNDAVSLDGQAVAADTRNLTIIFNKPTGYVCSRAGQGSRTIYELLPARYHQLKPVGRLDKDSSGLLLLTNDGDLANQLTHPRYAKTKVYEISLRQPLAPLHQQMINDHGVQLDDGPSRLALAKLDATATKWQITMSQGRNRQIRRTFAALGYGVDSLRRVSFGSYGLDGLAAGQFQELAV
jgi:23S rRNA pseudouridine2605 synthase